MTDEFLPPPRTAGSRWPMIIAVVLGLVAGLSVYRFVTTARTTSSAAPGPREVAPRADLTDHELTVIELFEHASPSVVFITNVALRRNARRLNVLSIPQGSGSGFVWDTAGHIVTNYHVIYAADALEVRFGNASDRGYRARVVGTDPDKDLAVLRIEAEPELLRPLPIGRSADLRVGQSVLAIGNPFGLDHTLTTGVVSALGRSIEALTGRTIEDVIQTDAAINPGNSGGPLLDSGGRLIGVNTAIFSPSGSSAGIGFAVPVDTVNRVVPQLIAFGRVHRPQLGIGVLTERMNRRLTRRLGTQGVIIKTVEPDSAAAAAGFRAASTDAEGRFVPGDIIQRIDDLEIHSVDDLLNALEKHEPDDTIEVTVRRGDEDLTEEVTLQ